MLVATFNETTAWADKTITHEGDAFILEDHGPITAAGVMEYDRQGHLLWATAGTRAWVGSLEGASALPFSPPGAVGAPPKGALIATFGPTTEWAGKTINHENQQFILEGHGPISSATVLQYDGQGHLLWPYPEMREWVVSQAAAPKRYKLSRVEWVLVGFGILVLFGRLAAALG